MARDREERPAAAPEAEAEEAAGASVVWFVRDPEAGLHAAVERFRVEGLKPLKLTRRQALEYLVREALQRRSFLPGGPDNKELTGAG